MNTNYFQLRPLAAWSDDVARTPAAARKSRRTFRVNEPALWEDLARELAFLKADGALIFLFITLADIAFTGRLKKGTRVTDPGIVLCFNGRHGEVSMPCDTYGGWHSNLRAVSLTLTALRAVERYGVAKGGEQYRGWQPHGIRALPAGRPKLPEIEAELVR